MVDIGDLGGGAGQGRRFPEFEKSAAQQVSEARKASFDDANSATKAIREALGISGTSARRGSLVDQQLGGAEKAIRDALGGSLGDYYKSRGHMRDVFGMDSLAEKAARMINGPTETSEAERYMAELRPSAQRSLLQDLPPFELPPNPIQKTNEHLADLSRKIDALVDLSAKQADVVDKLLQVQIAKDEAQERATQRTYRLGVISAGLATVLGIGAIVVTMAVAG